MERIFNPFAESNLTEQIAPDDFVKIFSPMILEQADALFRHGNVILAGTPGTGKSMLLALLKPETRIAYFKAGIEFPISQGKFISAGIHMIRAGAQDFGHRLAIGEIAGEKEIDLTLFFADFFNYYLVYDLLKGLEIYLDEDLHPLHANIGLNISREKLDATAKEIAASRCWFGYLEEPDNYRALLSALDARLTAYKSYFNFNIDALPENIRKTKTTIGEPIAAVASILRSEKLIDADTSVFIRVDQVEELYHIESKYGLGSNYRQIINKALAMRDNRISYRIGMRHYALEAETRVFGSGSKLEEERDFSIVDLDSVLKRTENQRNWNFPKLASDVFRRRLQTAGYFVKKAEDPVRTVFGAPLSREVLAERYGGSSINRVLDDEKDWPDAWKQYLLVLAEKDLLSAKLGEAWARQKGKADVITNIPSGVPPWETKKWWKKERKEHALMFIASKANQRLIWSGDMDIYELSGGNVMVFITLCRHIWQAWLRSDDKSLSTTSLPSINPNIQATGVYDASRSWFEKVIPQGFNGNSRQKIVRELGEWFSKKLHADKAMSYPGHNGISITQEEFGMDDEIIKRLKLGVGFGDLVSSEHRTRLNDKRLRRKWYLAPVLSPYFRIPHIHTKEPIYTSLRDLRKILSVDSDVQAESQPLASLAKSSKREAQEKISTSQLGLFEKTNK